MPFLKVVCGDQDGPIAGSNIFESSKLANAQVGMIVVNNVPENDLGSSPDFTSNPFGGRIQRTNNWQIGDKLIVIYETFTFTNCQC